MSFNEVWFTVKLAFRIWSEVLPKNFQEDNTSPASDVDILIGFGKGMKILYPISCNYDRNSKKIFDFDVEH